MGAECRRSSVRRRAWLGGGTLAGLLLTVYALLPYFGIGRGVTEANGRRIAAGMTRAEVEAVLGTPNPLADLAGKGEEFWDAGAALGCRYVAVRVTYDAEGQVVSARVSGSWRRPLWLPR